MVFVECEEWPADRRRLDCSILFFDLTWLRRAAPTLGERSNETQRVQGYLEGRLWAAFVALPLASQNAFAVEDPLSTSARVYREFDAENCLQGTAGWLTMAIPLP